MSIAILAWKAPTYRPIKTARQKRRCRSVPSRVVSLCLHIALTGTVTAPCKTLSAASTKKVFGSNIPSAIVRGVACCCACSAGCPAMIAWRVAAGPTVRRQGSRCERPAPPACGLDRPPLARPFAAMRPWLVVHDCAQTAGEVRGRSTSARFSVDFGCSADWPSLPQWRHGSPSRIKVTACAGQRVTRRSLRLCARARSS